MIIAVLYIVVLLLCLPTVILAQEPSSLHVQKMDGITQTTLLITIEKITFEADVLVMTTSEGEFRLPLDDVEKITFGENDVSAVENVNTSSICISKSGNLLSIKSDYAIKKLYVVDMSGRVLNGETLASVYEGTITLPNLGVFVLFMETSQGYIARKVINN